MTEATPARLGESAGRRIDDARDQPRPNVGVPSQPVFDTSSMMSSGPVHFTSTLPSVLYPTPSVCSTSWRRRDPEAVSRSAIVSRLSI